MFNWSRPVSSLSPEAIRYDVHSHILPGVDDGAQSTEEALQSIEMLKELGYHGAVLTPHIYRDVFDNDEPTLIERFESFRNDVAEQIGGFQLELAAEYLLDDVFLDKLYDNSERLLTFGNDRPRVLIEFSGLVEPLNTPEMLDECQRQGITPVIAHIERYPFVINDRDEKRAREWRQHGAVLQMNLGSLVGQYGSLIQRAARRLWKGSYVDLLGTDLHRPRKAQRFLTKAWDYIRRKPNDFDPAGQKKLFETPNVVPEKRDPV